VALEAMARHHSLQLLWQGVLLVLWRMGQLVVVVVASVALAASVVQEAWAVPLEASAK